MIWFLNGRYIDSKKAKIPINDLAILRGYGVFDFLVTYNRKPFLLDEHINRLFGSAKKIDLTVPYQRSEVKKYILRTIDRNKGKNLTLRIVVTGGTSSTNIFPEEKSNFAILVGKRTNYSKDCYEKGTKLKTYEHWRFEPTAKHINYLPAVVEKGKAVKKGFLEVLYVYKGEALECTTSNFYVVKNGVLVTPKKGILGGITKNVVLELARGIMKVEEKPVLLGDLKKWDEALISASDKEIMPVIRIDDHKIGSGKPGEYTKKLIKLFKEYTKKFGQDL